METVETTIIKPVDLKVDLKDVWRFALLLSFITVGYNLIEGLVSIYFGLHDETLALFGFGVDSFVEVISGVGVAHLVYRMLARDGAAAGSRDRFEKTALRITGLSFYLLTIGLIAGAALTLYTGRGPETTFWGIVISGLSLSTMWFLYRFKLSTGQKLNSEAIIADAKCTKACFALSFVLLASSGLYALTGIGILDVLGALGIAFFAFREGREAFEKASNDTLACGDHCC